MRCGTRIVSKGDLQAKVLKFSGEPVQKLERLSYRAGIHPDQRTRTTISVAPDNASTPDDQIEVPRIYRYYGSTEVVVENWTYNLGPHKLMRIITFKNSVVVKVQTLGYGYNE
jgi:hypothetical protein